MPYELVPIRLSHLLGHSGVGAIVRGTNGLVVVQDTRHWTDRQGSSAGELIPYVERVRAALGIEEELREPPVAKELAKGQVDGACVPAMRFPSWTRCPACGAMYRWPWQNTKPDYAPLCNQQDCNGQLEQVTWALAHPEGYLADVPWHFLVHKDAREPTQRNCKVQDQLRLIDRGYPLYGQNPTPGQLRESEFKAFLEVLPDQREDEDLVTRNRSDEWSELEMLVRPDSDERKIIQGVRHLVRVDRLKAVKVFKGFTRLGGKKTVSPNVVGKPDWLPAMELYGEGIFFALDEHRLKDWEQTPAVVSRLKPLLPRFAQSGSSAPNPLFPRFMLLHTLSHLLMRQIGSECGYPAASLLERIYCASAPEPMAAILIHVAVPDLAGSLGGLAELSESRRFLGILVRALEHSRWCSLDPVCSEHEGQGPGLLNRSACHACALVPEPACEYGNTLLDRGFVKDDAANGLPSFFGLT